MTDGPDQSVIPPSDGWWGHNAARTEVSHAGDQQATDEVASQYRRNLGQPGTKKHEEHVDYLHAPDAPEAPDTPVPTPPNCFCGQYSARLLSRSERNPNRWFYKCAKFKDDPTQCKFFAWEDEIGSNKGHLPPPAVKRKFESVPINPPVDSYAVPDVAGPAASLPILAPPPNAPVGDGDQCFKCGGFGHWSRDCPHSSTAPLGQPQQHHVPLGMSMALAHPPPVNGAPGGTETYTGANNTINTSSDTCYKCGGTGHWARDCPAAGAGNNGRGGYGGGAMASAGNRPANKGSCYLCGSADHWARDCPSKGQQQFAGTKRRYSGGAGGGSGTGSCYRCGQSGHWSNACPNK